MAMGDVHTLAKRGQWVNRVVDDDARSSSHSSRDEAIEQGRLLAARLGVRHVVLDAEPTGAPTDEDPATRSPEVPRIPGD